MAQDGAYGSQSLEYAVDTAAWYQVVPQSDNNLTVYRVRCLTAGYIQWFPSNANNAAPTNGAPVAPAIGAPVPNTKGMSAGQVEVWGNIPTNAWFRASTGATFEVSAGEGV